MKLGLLSNGVAAGEGLGVTVELDEGLGVGDGVTATMGSLPGACLTSLQTNPFPLFTHLSVTSLMTRTWRFFLQISPGLTDAVVGDTNCKVSAMVRIRAMSGGVEALNRVAFLGLRTIMLNLVQSKSHHNFKNIWCDSSI